MHAVAFLKDVADRDVGPVVILKGDERSLKITVIHALCEHRLGGNEVGLLRLPGGETDYKSLRDELFTISMWSDRKIVVVEDADSFVSNHRAQLQGYCDAPARKAVLVLDVRSEAASTNLSKRVTKTGSVIECTALKGSAVTRWLRDTAKQQFHKQLAADAAQQLVELVGNQWGVLQQELSKLSTYVGERSMIDAGTVRRLVGGRNAETAFEMIRALCDNRMDQALEHLEKLIRTGEAPQRTFGAIKFSFRKFAEATERSRTGASLRAALATAGVFPKDIAVAERYLRRIGRVQAEQIHDWLLETELNLKGSSREPERLILERLLIRLSGRV